MNPKDIEILRKRQSESEDRLDRSWMPEKGQRVLRGGNIHYEISDRVRAVDCGGLGVIQLLVKQLELAETIDQRVQGLRSKSVRKRPKIPILASRSHSEGPPAGDHRRMRPTRAAFSPKVDHRGLNDPQKESIERPRS